MSFPAEIFRLILRAATYVPGALDTSYEAIRNEDRDSMLAVIADSMDVKCTLCLVCKAFNEITQEYLYEIITVHTFSHVPNLVKSLLTVTHNGQTPGRWCRRLDFYVGQRRNVYHGVGLEGLDMLWGLIPLCPNVSTLICRCRFSPGQSHAPSLPSFPLFWRAVAMAWSSSLRRMEIIGMLVRSERLGLFLRYFRNLEICYIIRIEPFEPDTQVFDGDDPLPDDDDYLQMQGMDTNARALIRRYQDTAASGWVPYDGDPPYVLPSLHTLHLEAFPPGLSQYKFPNLRILGAYDRRRRTPDAQAIYSLYEEVALACSGSSSLTRFTHGSPISIDVWQIFDSFHHLTELTLFVNTDFDYRPRVHYTPRYRQSSLTWLRLIDITASAFDVEVALEILLFVRRGIFPSLKHIIILTTPSHISLIMKAIDFEYFKSLGISVEVSDDDSYLDRSPPEIPGGYP